MSSELGVGGTGLSGGLLSGDHRKLSVEDGEGGTGDSAGGRHEWAQAGIGTLHMLGTGGESLALTEKREWLIPGGLVSMTAHGPLQPHEGEPHPLSPTL